VGHPIEITCTDQPADQMIGAVSVGPDGARGTADDVGSWQLGREVTDVVRGARWVAAPPKPERADPPRVPHPAPRPTRPATDDDIPRKR